ncbi:hypothetical protein INR49_019314 [Caranx melampygus]|nr:hypothetical protein INR49_019314 [Caranx melampygus]
MLSLKLQRKFNGDQGSQEESCCVQVHGDGLKRALLVTNSKEIQSSHLSPTSADNQITAATDGIHPSSQIRLVDAALAEFQAELSLPRRNTQTAEAGDDGLEAGKA